MRSNTSGLSLLLLLLLFPCLQLCAQEYRATLSGKVTDATGGAVADAAVTAKATATGAAFRTITSADGAYQIPFLTPGAYSLTVEKPGFKQAVREGLNLGVAEKAVIDVALTIGEVNQSVLVTGDTPVIQTESADRGLNIESNRVLNTPLQGRNIFANAWSAPGVAVTASVTRLRPFDILGSSSMAVSGGQPYGNEVLIDGVSNLASARQVAYVPQEEATGEFKVQTTSYDAEYGWTTGGVVNIITKSGTNQFHGSAFEYLQNTHLDANTFNSNRNGTRRQSSHINTFGGDIGGPIHKDKLFGTFSYENIRQIIPDPFATSVPTALQRTGDFSQTYYGKDASGNLLQTIYDPFSTQAGPNGQLVRTAFPGNVIPSSRLNPIAAKVFSIIPGGNVPGDPVSGLNNLISNGSTRKFTDFFPEYTGRVDYNISDKTRMFVRYSRNALAEERGFHYSTTSQVNIAETSGNTPFKRENHSATIQATHTLNATTVLDFRVGLARFLSQNGSSIGAGYNLSSLGFAPRFVSEAASYFPKFNWAGYEGAGSQPVQNDPISQTNSFQGTLAKAAGRHNLKIGGEFRLQRQYSRTPGYTAGNFTFNQLFTGANPLAVSPTSGNSLASFLLGTPQSGYINVNSWPALQQRLWSGFFQDDIHVTSRLTVNVGLRWDYLGPLTDRFNALTRGFDTTSPSPLKVPGMDVVGGLLFAGVNGDPRGIYAQDWDSFGPRFGAAYRLTGKTVLRGGYGLIYAQTFDNPGSAPGFSQQTQMVTSIQTGIPANTLTDPFPNGILHPVGSSLGLATFLGQGFNFADPTRQIPYTHQFSFEIQRELPGRMLVTAAYVGSRAHRLEVTQPFNEISLQSLALGALALTANVPNPMAGLVPATVLNAATVQRQQLLRPFPQFLSINELDRGIGESEFDSFQLLLYKRLSQGLNFSASYTNSKTIQRVDFASAQDTQLEKVLAPWDIPQNLQLNGVYELPVGQGKPFAANAAAPVRAMISGWQVSAIARLQEGMPMNFPSNATPTGADPRLSNSTLDRWFNTCTQLPTGATRGCVGSEQPVWGIRQPFTLQTWSTRLGSVRVPGVYNLDISVMKHTRIKERVDVLFRTDFLNATNTPQFFSGPIVDVNSANFGRISGAMDQSNLPRFIQLSMKVQF